MHGDSLMIDGGTETEVGGELHEPGGRAFPPVRGHDIDVLPIGRRLLGERAEVETDIRAEEPLDLTGNLNEVGLIDREQQAALVLVIDLPPLELAVDGVLVASGAYGTPALYLFARLKR